ncbi:hypothetical protein ACS0TY_009375 [Phlomoides rotata]
MPPEQLPWDRRDFRKHERSGSDPRFGGGGFGGGGPHRWREQHHHPHAPPPHPTPYHHNNQPQQRWYSDFRSSRPSPPGHAKQGGWHMYPDEGAHGFLPFTPRYGDRNVEDDNFRPFGSSRGDGRYFRNSRENRGSVSQKDWRSPSWEPAASSSGPGRPTNEVNNQRSVEDSVTVHESNCKSKDSTCPLPDTLPGNSPSLMKENHEKNGGTPERQADLDEKTEKENGLGSIDWKPLKWSRSGSLSSRGSGFSHSSSSKSMGVDSVAVVEVQRKNATPVQSPAAVCAASPAPAPSPSPSPSPSDDTSSRKKPRLGWGEGLAKYEKKKVVGPEEGATKDVPVVSVSDTEVIQLPSVNLLDKSPVVASLSGCTSPATPSSFACSFSPGVEEKESIKTANIDNDTANTSCSPSTMSQTQYDGPTLSLENLELASIAKLSSLINELLQSDDMSSVETGYAQTTSMNKLLVWKVNILKTIEVTESEIDSLETELKSLVAEPKSSGPHPAAPSLLQRECHLKTEERVTGSSSTLGPIPPQVVTSGAMIIENLPAVPKDNHAGVKDDEIDSPGSATSKLHVVLPSGEDNIPSETPRRDDIVSLDPYNSRNLEKDSESDQSSEGETFLGDDHKLIKRNCQDLIRAYNAHYDIYHIYDSMMSSNKDSFNIAMEELNNLLPAQQSLFDISTASSVSCFQRDSSVIKEKFLMKKRSLKFKEKVIALKFKVFQHFWKEDRVVSIRKLRGKSHKKFDLSRTGCKKNRSSGRSRFSYTAGCSRTVPAEEVIEFINGLLELPVKPCRNTLKMPALILDNDVRKSRFISNNALVEDPCAVEKERLMINPWTPEERELFIDKLADFGKNFVKIASFMEHKTVADCIEFYYKNHKSELFDRAKKKPDVGEQRKSQSSTYLVATGKRWNREVNAASLDMLGEASVIAANEGVETQQKCTSRIFMGASSSYKTPRSEDGPLQRSNSLDMYSNETVAADVLAGICGSLSSEAVSSCITTSVDPIDGHQDRKFQRVGSCVKRPLTPDVTQNVDDECSDESCGEMESADWTNEEKSNFIQAITSYGKDFSMISRCVGTRSREQCITFFSKARKSLGLDQIQPAVGNAVSGDVNGGDSDTEDACVVQINSAVCNDGSECKIESNLLPPDVKLNHESDIAGEHNMKPNIDTCVDTMTPPSLDSMADDLALKNLSTSDMVVDDNPAVDFNVESEKGDGANGACGCEDEVRTLTVSSNVESVGVEGDSDGQPNGVSATDQVAVAEASDGHHGKDNEGERPFLPEDNLGSKIVEAKDANSTEVAVVSHSVNGMTSEPQMAGNVVYHSAHAPSTTQIEYGQQRMQADCNTEKPCVISSEQSGHFPSMESSTLFSVPIKYQKHPSSNARPSGCVNGTSEKNPQRIVRTVDYQQQQHLSGFSLTNPVDFTKILSGYPVSVNGKKQHLENVLERDEKLLSDRCTDFSLQKCSGHKLPSEVAQVPFPSHDRSRDLSRPQSGSSSDADKPSRNGDVKLFGKILTSSQQKPDACVRGKGDDLHQKSGCQTLNLRFSGDQKVNLGSSRSKFDCGSFLGSENIPVRGFSFWDGNRTKTGFPTLPDSTVLLAKYPAAFSNHSTPAMKIDQPPVHGAIRTNDHSLNGVSVFPNRELGSSNGGVADYQVMRNRELQPFALDMKQPQDVVFSEMQRRNGFDVASGMQQQARGMVGINVVGRGGLLVGGQCSGVSDPVTAIKMHYAKAQNLSMQASNGVREDETWTSNGDVGR